MALDATPGGPVSNAYVTVADATTFLEERFGTEAWDEAPPEDQATALIWATRLLNEHVAWIGVPTTTTQALPWPRTGVVDGMGRPVPPDVVPADVQRATATYALALLEDASTAATGLAAGTVKRTKIGDTDIEYFQPGTTGTAVVPTSPQTSLPADVAQMIGIYAPAARGYNIPILRT